MLHLQCSGGDPCKQCVKKGLVCGGYHDTLDFYFRNETDLVIARALSGTSAPQVTSARISKQSKNQSSKDTATEELPTQATPIQVRFTLPLTVWYSAVDVSVNYLLGSFIPGTDFDFLANIFDDFSSSKCFRLSTEAVALAHLSRERQDYKLMHRSRDIYVRAIRTVNSALQSTQEVMENSTLVATLVLGLFEAVAFNDEHDTGANGEYDIPAATRMDSWIAHTNGTLALIKFRGQQLLQTDFGKRIFNQIAHKVRANCAQHAVRPPRELLELDKELKLLLPSSTSSLHFWSITDMAIEIRVRSRGRINALCNVC
jgi:Fungal specific transcription factor domain